MLRILFLCNKNSPWKSVQIRIFSRIGTRGKLCNCTWKRVKRHEKRLVRSPHKFIAIVIEDASVADSRHGPTTDGPWIPDQPRREGSSAETWNRASRFRIKPVDFAVVLLRPSGHAQKRSRATIPGPIPPRIIGRNREGRETQSTLPAETPGLVGVVFSITLRATPARLLLARASIRIMEAVILVLLYGLPPWTNAWLRNYGLVYRPGDWRAFNSRSRAKICDDP